MDAPRLFHALSLHGDLLVQAFVGLEITEALWRPAPEKWSPLEILGHLLDEEQADFRERLRLTLADPEAAWPRIDPEGWVRERRHQERDPAELLADFRAQRARSLRWLQGLSVPDWNLTHAHPELGPLRAGDLLCSWAAHDLLHLRQLANTRLAFLREAAGDFSPAYAGA